MKGVCPDSYHRPIVQSSNIANDWICYFWHKLLLSQVIEQLSLYEYRVHNFYYFNLNELCQYLTEKPSTRNQLV